jgi:hypothetical protein
LHRTPRTVNQRYNPGTRRAVWSVEFPALPLAALFFPSTTLASLQGPSASAYVTYHKPEDALRAIQAVNNIHVDGRTLKASLGTTKYCSHFLRGSQCPKPVSDPHSPSLFPSIDALAGLHVSARTRRGGGEFHEGGDATRVRKADFHFGIRVAGPLTAPRVRPD